MREDEAHYEDQGQLISHEGEEDIRMESSGEEEGSDPSGADSPGHSNSPETQPQEEADAEDTPSWPW